MSFEFPKPDPSKDPEKLVFDTLTAITGKYEQEGIIADGTAGDHVRGLTDPLAEAI